MASVEMEALYASVPDALKNKLYAAFGKANELNLIRDSNWVHRDMDWVSEIQARCWFMLLNNDFNIWNIYPNEFKVEMNDVMQLTHAIMSYIYVYEQTAPANGDDGYYKTFIISFYKTDANEKLGIDQNHPIPIMLNLMSILVEKHILVPSLFTLLLAKFNVSLDEVLDEYLVAEHNDKKEQG